MLGLTSRSTMVCTYMYLIIGSMSPEIKGFSWLTDSNHLTHQADTAKDLPQAINSMSGCAIRVFNFNAINYNGSYLNVPIILMRYYTLPSLKWILIPHEVDQRNKTAMSLYLTGLTQSSRNGLYRTSNPYPDISYKNGICEAKIYLYPPNESSVPTLYYTSDYGKYIKDPQVIDLAINFDQHSWRTDYFSSTLKIYLLVCQKIDDSVLESLSDTIQILPAFSQFYPAFLIWETMENEFYYQCDYCNKCAPYQIVRVENYPTTRLELIEILELSQNHPPPYFSIVLSSFNYDDQIIDQGFHRNQLNIIKSIQPLDSTGLSFFQIRLEMHLIALLAPDNATMDVTNRFPEDMYYWRHIKLNECAEDETVGYAAASRPGFHRFTSSTYETFSVQQLILRIDRLRLISCHREEISWIHNLRELAVAFDLATWCILVLTILVYWLLSCVFHKIYAWVSKSKEVPKRRLFDVGFQLSSSLLDQSVSLFQNLNVTQNGITWWAFIFQGIMLPLLSKLYKGENITSLTVPPPLVAFDTFESLVKNKFDVYTLPHLIAGEEEEMFPEGTMAERRFLQSNDHEATPVVSQLWYFVNLQYGDGWKTLYQFLNDKSLGVSNFFKNSKLFPSWSSAKGLASNQFQFEQLVSPHLIKCDHSAVILEERVARTVYTNFSFAGAPVFMGKDVIFENFKGLSLFGHFDKRTISRINFFGESGIVDWWRKYFVNSYDLVEYLKLRQIYGNNTSKNEFGETGGHNIMGLAIIPCIGLSAAMIIFIVLENGIHICLIFENGSLSFCGFVHRETTVRTVKNIPVLQVVE